MESRHFPILSMPCNYSRATQEMQLSAASGGAIGRRKLIKRELEVARSLAEANLEAREAG